MKRAIRFFLRVLSAFVVLLLVAVVAAIIILPSAWFRDKVRERIIYEAERATGGRVEIGAYKFDWKQLRAEVAPFVLRGKEPAGERPLFRADSVKVGLKIISVLKKDVDIASLVIDRPEINILVDAEGRTNFPEPKVRRATPRDPIEVIVSLAIRDIVLRNGELTYLDHRLPLDIQGQDLEAQLAYDFTGPRYKGDLTMQKLRVDTKFFDPLVFAFDSRLSLERGVVGVEQATLTMPRSRIDLVGAVRNLRSPSLAFDVKMIGDLAELGKPLRLPRPHTGDVQFAGKLTYSAAERYVLSGKVRGSGLGYDAGDLRIRNASLTSYVRLTPDGVLLRGLDAALLGGRLQGVLNIEDYKRYRLNGEVRGMDIQAIAAARGVTGLPWMGSLDGPVEARGTAGRRARDLLAAGRFHVTEGQGGSPIRGFVEVTYNQLNQSIQLGQSYLETPATRMEFTGTLGELLRVQVKTTDLKDLLPAMAFASPNAPKELPLTLLNGGAAAFQGTVTGPTRSARIEGDVTLTSFEVRNQTVDRLTAALAATSEGITIRSLALGQGDLRLEGNAEIGLTDWRAAGGNPVSGQATLRGAQLSKLLAGAGQKVPVEGLLSATVEVEGTFDSPQAVARLAVDKPRIYGEEYERIRAQVRYKGGLVELIDGQAEIGTARLFLTGAYEHAETDWKNGRLRFDFSTRGLRLAQIRNLQQVRPGFRGLIDVKAAGTAEVRNAQLLLSFLNGKVTVQNLAVQDRPVGDLSVDAVTRGGQLDMALSGNLRGAKVSGSGTLRMAGVYPASGKLEFSPVAFSTLKDLAFVVGAREPLPFDGFISGQLTFSGPARTPELMTARLEVPSLEIVPSQPARPAQRRENLALRNTGPVILEYDSKGVHVRSAHLTGRDTDLRITGTLNLRDKTPWDLRINGNLNLAILQDFREDLLTSGKAVVNATIRGTLTQPQINGRMEVKDASVYLADVPSGIDKANGIVLFDRNRATIERLTAQVGGGDLTLSGFIAFGGNDLNYRLQGRADSVRIRYPEGVSTSVNATLTLVGSPGRSLLSGVVTILRAGFNPRTDFGSLLAEAAKPIATPATPNEFLRGLQLDIEVESVPNLVFQTALTSDLQAEADLRLRGTAAKPAVLGRISVNQGEVQFFGNRYTINRGEIGFYNPVSIEPVLDMDLETRVRGVVVNIALTGPLKRLNVSYRSDPPLQSPEIIALLTVGRAPGTSSSLASSQIVQSQGFLSSSSNNLLGQAVSAPVSSRLQRFFGVSRLKIDPQLTGINAVPQARLTIEQQISKNVTLTYITNLSSTNQQIVRLEWDLNRNWSLVALREDNGVFGVDFFYKARFK